METYYNIGDIIFQLIAFLFLIFVIVMIVVLARSFRKQNKRLEAIEEKLEKALDDK